MFQQYRAVFRAPGSAAFCAAAFVMRIPIAMYPIGLVLLLSIRTGHYGTGGLLSGAYTFGAAVGMPIVGRVMDRIGQGRVLLPAVGVHVVAAACLVTLAQSHVGTGWWFVPVVVIGFAYPAVGSLSRARWSYVLAGTPELSTAYSLESVLDEVIFVVGPIIASVLATQVDPLWVIVLAAVFVALGAAWLRTLRETEPPVQEHGDEPHRSALAIPGMALLVVTMIGMGGIFASVEVVMAAFAGQHDERSSTGLVLACFALGSGLSGLFYGARQWHTPVAIRYWLHALVFAALIPLLLVAGSVDVLYAIAVVVGLGIAPTLITGFGMVEQLMPARGLTEGLAWVTTGLNVGYGSLAAVVGAIADRHGAHNAFYVSVGAGVFVATGTTVLLLSLRRVHRQPVVPG
ncbi:MAG: MFS transporter [Jatrophihabitans sp.]